MARFGERFLLGFTSPRTPKLISEYIKVIEKNNLENLPYDTSFQEKFYMVLSEAKVAGEEAGTAKDKALAGRDKLTRMPQALGFFITQRNKKFQVTEAGKLLKDEDLFEDVLLHQILKFQLPSPLHKESESNAGKFRIKPFLEIIRLIDELGYLSYKELMIFGMTLTDYRNFEKVIEKIKKYREQREVIKQQKKSLRVFDYETQLSVFKELYADIIQAEDFKTRETVTKTAEAYMKKKLSNWGDYTDSIFRILRATGVVVFSKGRTLTLSSERSSEIKYILENIDREIVSIDMKREDFDLYISNPYKPLLLNDDKDNLINTLRSIGSFGNNDEDIYVLKHRLNQQRNLKKQEKVESESLKLKKRYQADIDDILQTFEAISNREIEPASMRPTFFEWNIWRAMTMINHGDVRGNFVVDDSGMPVSTAGGGQSDIVGDYGEFNIGIEVTLSTGQKQFEMEGEPVSRHIGEMQVKKPTFGLFIADVLNESVINYFYTLSHQKSKIYNGTVDIIPMNTTTFIEFFKQATNKDINPKDLFSIHEHSIQVSKQMLIEDKTEDDWYKSVIKKVFTVVE
ncbi:AlwI family type II restriction endonuclease [Streptococcus castoreus]|uniref:AlwI family type II restriction endonuclease n=1 Tax=Streptococcus castoreus TaxID=254786 RepID=UPI00040972BA|nr:AlwI family type II restriction endonuclease [Streptococcus castoreus]